MIWEGVGGGGKLNLLSINYSADLVGTVFFYGVGNRTILLYRKENYCAVDNSSFQGTFIIYKYYLKAMDT